jgi:hypothetical protein
MAQTEITTSRVRGRAELIAALSDSRAGITHDAADLADLANVPKRIRRSLCDTPIKRAAAALVAGLLSSKILSKKNRDPKLQKSGWLHRLVTDLDLKKSSPCSSKATLSLIRSICRLSCAIGFATT